MCLSILIKDIMETYIKTQGLDDFCVQWQVCRLNCLINCVTNYKLSYFKKGSIFWYITPCSPLKVYRRFEETC
jgi:hypothetical protein